MKAEVEWIGGVAFKAKSETGHTLVIDGPPDKGGMNQGMRPMEAVLAGSACCSAYDVVHILEKSRTPPTSCRVEVVSERAESEPRVFTSIHLRFTLSGNGLTESKVARAVSLSVEKYCSALKMLERTAKVTYEHQITS